MMAQASSSSTRTRGRFGGRFGQPLGRGMLLVGMVALFLPPFCRPQDFCPRIGVYFSSTLDNLDSLKCWHGAAATSEAPYFRSESDKRKGAQIGQFSPLRMR
jgi:hypothetical protein